MNDRAVCIQLFDNFQGRDADNADFF